MNRESQPNTTPSKQELLDAANAQLQSVLKNLKETKKILARDWEQLTPRERSAYSREVKTLEQQKKTLLEEIEMNSTG